jgi:hypothetical protein
MKKNWEPACIFKRGRPKMKLDELRQTLLRLEAGARGLGLETAPHLLAAARCEVEDRIRVAARIPADRRPQPPSLESDT